MNIDHIQFELRRRRLDEIFDFGVTVLRHYPGLFFRFSAPLVLFFFALNFVFIALLRPTLVEGEDFDGFWQNLLLAFVLLVEQSVVRLPLLLTCGRLLFQQSVSRADLRADFRAVAGGYFLRTVLMRNFLFFVLWPRYFFLSEVVALERTPGERIRPRLENLTRRQSDRILGFRLIAFFLGLVFVLVGLFFFRTILEIPGLEKKPWWLSADFSLLSPVLHVFLLVFAVYHTTARFLFYIDTRSLLEGWDIEKMLLKGMRESNGNP